MVIAPQPSGLDVYNSEDSLELASYVFLETVQESMSHKTQYVVLSKGTKLNRSIHPGAYPATASVRIESHIAYKSWAHQAVVKVLNNEWVSEKNDEDIGYQALEPLELLELLRQRRLNTSRSQTFNPRFWSCGTEWKHWEQCLNEQAIMSVSWSDTTFLSNLNCVSPMQL